LKRLSRHGDFCGSSKWSRDSNGVVVYCVPAQDTWAYRGTVDTGETKLIRMDIATGDAAEVTAGPGVKMFPALLPTGEIAYVRTDTSAPGVFYAGGKPGPAGNLRCPS
jgi:hypothetical protein